MRETGGDDSSRSERVNEWISMREVEKKKK